MTRKKKILKFLHESNLVSLLVGGLLMVYVPGMTPLVAGAAGEGVEQVSDHLISEQLGEQGDEGE